MHGGKIMPAIKIVDSGIPPMFTKKDKSRIKVNIDKAMNALQLGKLRSPKEAIREIVKLHLNSK